MPAMSAARLVCAGGMPIVGGTLDAPPDGRVPGAAAVTAWAGGQKKSKTSLDWPRTNSVQLGSTRCSGALSNVP